MKILAKGVAVDRICDTCNESVLITVKGEKFEECGELKAQWGHGAKDNGNTYQLDLCENCFRVAILALRDHRRSIVMFDEEHDLPDENFGIEKFSNDLYDGISD